MSNEETLVNHVRDKYMKDMTLNSIYGAAMDNYIYSAAIDICHHCIDEPTLYDFDKCVVPFLKVYPTALDILYEVAIATGIDKKFFPMLEKLMVLK